MDDKLGDVGNVISSSTDCHGVDSLSLGVCTMGHFPHCIRRICGHSVTTLFPTKILMDLNFDLYFIN